MANSTLGVRILPEAERSTAHGAITNAYVALGTPLGHAAVNVIFDNQTDGVITVSWDGVNDWKTFAATSALVLDVQSNRSEQGGALLISQGTQFYIKYQSAPTTGSFYISVLYAYNAYNI